MKDQLAVSPGTLDALGGIERLRELWGELRTRLQAYSKSRNQAALDHLNSLLKVTAMELEEDIEHLLPRFLYVEFGRQSYVPSLVANPIYNFLEVSGRDKLRQSELHRVAIDPSEHVRFGLVVGWVLKVIDASAPYKEQDLAPHTKEIRRKYPLEERKPPIWTVRFGLLTPTVTGLLRALPFQKWSEASRKTGFSREALGKASQPLQELGWITSDREGYKLTDLGRDALGAFAHQDLPTKG